jgi:hypothetical protein
MASQMDLKVTIAAAAGFLALGVLCGWLGARPPNPHRGPRLIPYRAIMVACAVGVLMMLVHLVNLLGVTTGRPGM